MTNTQSVFDRLNSLNLNDVKQTKVGPKNKEFDYLSWADVETEVYKIFPETKIRVSTHPATFLPVFYIDDGTALVHVTAEIAGIVRECWYSIIDYKMAPIKEPTSSDISNAIQRAKVKAIAMHGLGMYLYRGEDIPPDIEEPKERRKPEPVVEERPRRQREEPKEEEKPKRGRPTNKIEVDDDAEEEFDIDQYQDSIEEFNDEQELMDWYASQIKKDRVIARKIHPLVLRHAKTLRQ